MYFPANCRVNVQASVLCALVLGSVLRVWHTERSARVLQIQLNVVRWAMIYVLKRPPPGFEEVVRKHFFLMRHRCLPTPFVTVLVPCVVNHLFKDVWVYIIGLHSRFWSNICCGSSMGRYYD